MHYCDSGTIGSVVKLDLTASIVSKTTEPNHLTHSHVSIIALSCAFDSSLKVPNAPSQTFCTHAQGEDTALHTAIKAGEDGILKMLLSTRRR